MTNPALITARLMAANVVRDRAREKIGEYQTEVGPFAAWAPLSEMTMADRAAQGYPDNNPILRSGELRDSYNVAQEGEAVGVGSELGKALGHEVGVPVNPIPGLGPIPPRPILGPALIESEKKIEELIGPYLFKSIFFAIHQSAGRSIPHEVA